MIPTNEIETLTMTVTDAIDFTAEGQVADGYAALVWGLHRVEEMVECRRHTRNRHFIVCVDSGKGGL